MHKIIGAVDGIGRINFSIDGAIQPLSRLLSRTARWGLLITSLVVGTAYANEPKFVVSEPHWVVPTKQISRAVAPGNANNNVALAYFQGKFWIAWRNAPTHFASKRARLILASSLSAEGPWKVEAVVRPGRDIREPHLVPWGDRLLVYYTLLGRNPLQFKPWKSFVRAWAPSAGGTGNVASAGSATNEASGALGPEVECASPGELAWDMQVRDGWIYRSTYVGNHYGAGSGNIQLRFQRSKDGVRFEPATPTQDGEIYRGGLSELGFTWDEHGDVWGVARNEDGDRTGMGSQVVRGVGPDLGHWEFPEKSDPRRFDSPKLFFVPSANAEKPGEIYLIARRDLGGPFGAGFTHLPRGMRKWARLAAYSLRPKRTALYRINRETRQVEWLVDLPSAADTAFPSIVRVDHTNDNNNSAHNSNISSVWVANYTSPFHTRALRRRSWIRGQTSPRGTGVYLLRIDFPNSAPALAESHGN